MHELSKLYQNVSKFAYSMGIKSVSKWYQNVSASKADSRRTLVEMRKTEIPERGTRAERLIFLREYHVPQLLV